MARKFKHNEPTVSKTIRVPISVLNSIPTDQTLTDHLLNMIQNRVIITNDKQITENQKITVKFFYNLFMSLFTEGKLDEIISNEPNLMEYAKTLGELLE